MNRPFRSVATLLFLIVTSSRGAEPTVTPSLTAIVPPGVTVGTTADWVVFGRDLGPLERFLISGSGIEVTGRVDRPDGSVALKVRATPDAEPGYREVRGDGPEGVSNLMLVRVDRLPQVAETEPNDGPAQAHELTIPSAVAGVLGPGDLDHFRVRGKGRGGRRVTIEVEARRLGAPIDPVMTISSPPGRDRVQARASRGVEHDCRVSYVLPPDADTIIQVHDNIYGGGPSAVYRLRIDDEPVPAEDEGKEDEPARSMVPLSLGSKADGRIGRPGEVDRYLVPVRAGDSFRVKVQAESLGSWLDSVVTLRDDRGAVLGENDDHGRSSDSVLDHQARSDGNLIVEVADRYGDGGPEYGYRLSVGPVEPEVTVAFRLAGPEQTMGAWNLRPGSSATIRLRVETEGRPGPVVIRAIGLPPGVSADPVTIRPGGSRPSRIAPPDAVLILRVASDAAPALGMLRVIATTRTREGATLTATATAALPIGTGPVTLPDRRVVRVVTDLPVRVVVPTR